MHPRAETCQSQCGRLAEAAAGAGNQGGPTGQDTGLGVICCPVSPADDIAEPGVAEQDGAVEQAVEPEVE